MEFFLKLMSLTTTICMLAVSSTLAANNTTEELARSESLGPAYAAIRQTQLREINVTNFSKPDAGKVLAFTNETVVVTRDRKLQVQNSTMYWRKSMFVRKATSQYSIPQLGITSSLQSHFTKMYKPVISAKDKRGHQHKHVHKRASKVKFISSWYQHDDEMNNISNITEDKQHNNISNTAKDKQHNNISNTGKDKQHNNISNTAKDEQHNNISNTAKDKQHNNISNTAKDEQHNNISNTAKDEQHNNISNTAKDEQHNNISNTAKDEQHNNISNTAKDEQHNNISNTAKDEQHNKPLTHKAWVVGNKTVEYIRDRSADPSITTKIKSDSLVKESRTRNHGICSCESTKCDYSYCSLTSVPQDLNFKITKLLLNNNDISIIPTHGFSHYTFLERLVLSNNKITILEDHAFYGLSRLTLLDLANNSLGIYANFSNRIFEPLTSLKLLLMEGNFCYMPSPDAGVFLAYLHNLEELFIDYFGSMKFGAGYRNLTLLRNLTLSCHCDIDLIYSDTFTNLEQITHLKILHCNFVHFETQDGGFSQLKNLTCLDISDNIVGEDSLQAILRDLTNSSLHTLRMDNCLKVKSVNYINSSITQYLPRTLKTLSARENNIISILYEGFVKLPKSLQFIDLRDNYMIMDLNDVPLEMLEELETLLISSNAKSCVIDDQYSSGILLRNGLDFRKYRTDMVIHSSENRNMELLHISWIIIPDKLKYFQMNINNADNLFLMYVGNTNSLEMVDFRCSMIAEFYFTFIKYLPKLWFINIGRSSIRKLIIDQDLILPQINVLNY